MVITRACIELSQKTGGGFNASISAKKTGLACYIVDGAFTRQQSVPSMSGEDYSEMIDIAIKSELGDLQKQPSPIFYFTRSRTFVMNFTPLYLTSSFSTESKASAGLFMPYEVDFFSTKTGGVRGEFQYSPTQTVYVQPAWITVRTTEALPTNIHNGTLTIANPADYNYDIDSKTATKTITCTEWKICEPDRSTRNSAPTKPSLLNITSDYVFKFGSVDYPGVGNSLTIIAPNSQTINSAESSIYTNPINATVGFIEDHGIQLASTEPLWKNSALQSKLNIPASYFPTAGSGELSYVVNRKLPDNISNRAYIAFTQNSHGVGDILQISATKDSVKKVGTAYTACGEVRFSGQDTLLDNSGFKFAFRTVAKESHLSGQTCIIRRKKGNGITIAESNEAYKISTQYSYYVVQSKPNVKTQLDQSYIMSQGFGQDNYLTMNGYMQSIVDDAGNHLTDKYLVGVLSTYGNGLKSKLYVLYDDNSLAISSYEFIGEAYHPHSPIRISADARNCYVDLSIIQTQYSSGIQFSASGNSASVGLPANGQFAVPENTGTKKIVAVGAIFNPTKKDIQKYGYANYSGWTTGCFLTLKPKP